MKYIGKNSITNIENTDIFDQKFLVSYLENISSNNRKIIFLRDEILSQKDTSFLDKIPEKPAMFANVFSEKKEYEIFEKIFFEAIKQKKYIHIVGLTLAKEIELVEKYYSELGFFDSENNTFKVDFSVPYVTIGVHIENIIWKGSDYKAQKSNIFFCPPIRQSGENKALMKAITRGIIAQIDFSSIKVFLDKKDIFTEKKGNIFTENYRIFFENLLKEEKIFPLQFGKILYYNLIEAGFNGEKKDFVLSYQDENSAKELER